jgi:hypothetical protein
VKKKKRSDVPLFLLYAGILHAIGLALLLPMLITLPGPQPKDPVFDIVVLPNPEPLADIGPEHTSALPLRPQVREEQTTDSVPAEAENLSPRSETSAVPAEAGSPGR